MPGRVRWLQIITLANVAVAVLVILALYGTMLALAAIAPEISTWQLLTLLAVGVPVSIIGFRLATKVGSNGWRRRGLIINGSAIVLYAAILIGMGFLLLGTTHRRFILPEGYKGDVYVVYSDVDGKPATAHEAVITFRIPTGGILYTTAPMVGGWTRDEYYYDHGAGTQRRIIIFGIRRFNEHRRILRTTKTSVYSFRVPAQSRIRLGARSNTKSSTSERKLTSFPATQSGTRIKS